MSDKPVGPIDLPIPLKRRKFEHMMFEITKPEHLSKLRFGDEGWEMVAVECDHRAPPTWTLFFKREVTDAG